MQTIYLIKVSLKPLVSANIVTKNQVTGCVNGTLGRLGQVVYAQGTD